eukprot:CAMPEP_0203813472 /NCGR_PEP_ID=MMETSP0115-20131106/4739_1 /ASSEMBLY_ACC=CAM_ASM_000227 /TAXON_ID=33651 /ORGANISM="Bicosoecid sp, Strain ms1" /LENGTH=457 /DNA_ID=CAMNT_0050722339 /DNA_START=12 /DNA_END=1385 /DNA_ORIENTATION=-
MAEDEAGGGEEYLEPLNTTDVLSGDHRDPHAEDGEDPSYTARHLAAVLKPVAITMLLASWVVANIREASQDAAIAAGLSVYMVYTESGSGNQSTGEKVGQSLVNALVIVSVICVVTFILVLCYKYRCLKLMIGYLMFASASLLGYSGGFVVSTAFLVYDVRIDWITFAFIMWNFAIVGVVAVFYQKGIPRAVTQSYLVAVSVIMSWIVTKFPEWTGWALLIALALYDLCAVLSPCGPLKALVKLAQERQDPIPGLVYEADVAEDSSDRVDRVRDTLSRPSGPGARSGGGGTDGEAASVRDVSAELPARGVDAEAGEARATAEETRAAGTAAGGGEQRTGGGGGASGGGDAAAAAPRPRAASYEHQGGEDRSIKLGLGDFVFYSVLVGKAALFDLTTLSACFVGVLMGLVGTLFLLGVFKKALPALPISILFGVVFYAVGRFALVPYMVELVEAGVLA